MKPILFFSYIILINLFWVYGLMAIGASGHPLSLKNREEKVFLIIAIVFFCNSVFLMIYKKWKTHLNKVMALFFLVTTTVGLGYQFFILIQDGAYFSEYTVLLYSVLIFSIYYTVKSLVVLIQGEPLY